MSYSRYSHAYQKTNVMVYNQQPPPTSTSATTAGQKENRKGSYRVSERDRQNGNPMISEMHKFDPREELISVSLRNETLHLSPIEIRVQDYFMMRTSQLTDKKHVNGFQNCLKRCVFNKDLICERGALKQPVIFNGAERQGSRESTNSTSTVAQGHGNSGVYGSPINMLLQKENDGKYGNQGFENAKTPSRSHSSNKNCGTSNYTNQYNNVFGGTKESTYNHPKQSNITANPFNNQFQQPSQPSQQPDNNGNPFRSSSGDAINTLNNNYRAVNPFHNTPSNPQPSTFQKQGPTANTQSMPHNRNQYLQVQEQMKGHVSIPNQPQIPSTNPFQSGPGNNMSNHQMMNPNKQIGINIGSNLGMNMPNNQAMNTFNNSAMNSNSQNMNSGVNGESIVTGLLYTMSLLTTYLDDTMNGIRGNKKDYEQEVDSFEENRYEQAKKPNKFKYIPEQMNIPYKRRPISNRSDIKLIVQSSHHPQHPKINNNATNGDTQWNYSVQVYWEETPKSQRMLESTVSEGSIIVNNSWQLKNGIREQILSINSWVRKDAVLIITECSNSRSFIKGQMRQRKINLPQSYSHLPNQFTGFTLPFLEIGNKNGRIKFIGDLNISDIDFSQALTIQNGLIEVEEERLLDQCHKIVISMHELPKSIEKYLPDFERVERELRRVVEEIGGCFGSYDRELGMYEYSIIRGQ